MAIQLLRSWRVAVVAFLLVTSVGGARQSVSPPDERARVERLMTAADLSALPRRAPDRRITYGADSSQYGELRIPSGMGPHPLVVLIHGVASRPPTRQLTTSGRWPTPSKQTGLRRGTLRMTRTDLRLHCRKSS
jgi:hypothetical protein